MNKLCILLLVAIAICSFDLPAYSQEYLTDVNTDRGSLTAAPPNVLGLLPVGANYVRVLKTNMLEMGRISMRGWDVFLTNNIMDSNQVPFLYRCIVVGRYSSSNTNNQPAGSLFFNIADYLAGIGTVRGVATSLYGNDSTLSNYLNSIWGTNPTSAQKTNIINDVAVLTGLSLPVDFTWDFPDNGIPASSAFQVTVNSGGTVTTDSVQNIYFKRSGYSGPLETDDGRVENTLYLQLSNPITNGAFVQVTNNASLWPTGMVFATIASPLRYSPAIHVNEEGYLSSASYPKLAMIGYSLGSTSIVSQAPVEMGISDLLGQPGKFTLVDATTGLPVNYTFTSGNLSQRSDSDETAQNTNYNNGYTSSVQYSNVLQVDFSGFTNTGQYILRVDGLGASFPFRIDHGTAMKVARTYALGLYHKRCGTGTNGYEVNDLPFTRFTHDNCHTNPASLPLIETSQDFTNAWNIIASYGSAPQPGSSLQLEVDQHASLLTNEASELFKFSTNSPQIQFTNGEYRLDVSGGHHDAGDYSKYTINSATLIHNLVFAADNFAGVGSLDNLGIPESGNGVGDLYDEAKREADFLLKMQDNGTLDINSNPVVPGGFYTLVYPRDEQYDGAGKVLPQDGDPQIVWPKTTSVTAAAVAALAEIGSSPNFCIGFSLDHTSTNRWTNNPYLAAAKGGWSFLMSAIDTHGKDNCFQRLYQYGDEFAHNDELAWAAAAMYSAGYTDTNLQHDPYSVLTNWFPNPNGGPTSQVPYSYGCNVLDAADMTPCWTYEFGWWGMYEGYGCATRDYAFAQKSGRLTISDTNYLASCNAAITNWGNEVRVWSQQNAYGTTVAPEYKDDWDAGFYFPSYWSYDIAVSDQIETAATDHATNLSAIVENMNYECGRNPNNVSFITGLGWKRQRFIVDQYSENDGLVLPATGIILGAIQYAFTPQDYYNFNNAYFPQVNTPGANSFPMYDRWVDAYSPETESVSHQIARGLCSAAYLAASTSYATQPWSAANIIDAAGTIALPSGGLPLNVSEPVQLDSTLDLSAAQIPWELQSFQPSFSGVAPTQTGNFLLEAEAIAPDGRRVFAVTNLVIYDPVNGGTPFTPDPNTLALFHMDSNWNDAMGGSNLTTSLHVASGNVTWVTATWPKEDPTQTGNMTASFSQNGDELQAAISATTISNAVYSGATNAGITLEAWIYPTAYSGTADYPFALRQDYNSQLTAYYQSGNSPNAPDFTANATVVMTPQDWNNNMTLNNWHHFRAVYKSLGGTNAQTTVYIDGTYTNTVSTPVADTYSEDWLLYLGGFDGYIDEVRISSVDRGFDLSQ